MYVYMYIGSCIHARIESVVCVKEYARIIDLRWEAHAPAEGRALAGPTGEVVVWMARRSVK